VARQKELAGQLGATYAIPVIYVPVLMITHVVAFYLLLRPQPKAVRALAGDAAASPRACSEAVEARRAAPVWDQSWMELKSDAVAQFSG
jgi:hypothetical protein